MKQFSIEDLSIESITVADASIENPDAISIEDQKIDVLRYGIAFEKLISVQAQKVLINFYLTVEGLDKKENQLNIKGAFKVQFIFSASNLNDYIEKDETNNSIQLEPQLSISALNIVYSTSRGIIYTRCLGTVLGFVILPVIASKELLDISNRPILETPNLQNKKKIAKTTTQKKSKKATKKK